MKKVLFILPIALSLGLMSCNKGGGNNTTTPEHEHIYVEHQEVEADCISTGTEFYYTCEGCDKYFDASKNEIASPVVIPIDPNNHRGTKVLVAGGEYKTAYRIGDEFDLSGLELKVKCEHCEGTKLGNSQMSKVKVVYPTENATSFTKQDLSNDHLQVELKYSTLSTKVNVTLSKKANEITGLTTLEGHCGFVPFTSLEGVSATFGTITYSFADSFDGEYKTATELGNEYTFVNKATNHDEATTYYVKATVPAGEDYEGVEATTTLTITHNDNSWDYSRDDYDVSGCVCETPIMFNKLVSEPNKDIVLTDDSHSISLDGTSYDSEKHMIESISYVVNDEVTIDLGTDLNNLNVAVLNEHPEYQGEATLEVLVETPEEGITPVGHHKVFVPVTFITKLIKTVDDLKSLRPQEESVRENVYGYYRMDNDIDAVYGLYETYFNNNDTKYAFHGVLDGAGHTLHCKSYAQGLFIAAEYATIKNINFVDHWSYLGISLSCTPLAMDLLNSRVENCQFSIVAQTSNQIEAPREGCGMLAPRKCIDSQFVNCDFNFENRNIGVLIGYGTNYARFSMENCTLNCRTYTLIYKGTYVGITAYALEGLDIQSGEVNGLLESQTIYVNHDDEVQSLDLSGTDFENLTPSSITIGEYELGTDLSALDLSDEFKEDLDVRGSQIAHIAFADFVLQLPVNVTFDQGQVLDIARQDILVSSVTKSISLAGTDYAGDEVIEIKYGSYDLGTNLADLDLPTELVNNKFAHGEGVLLIKLIHEGSTKRIQVPVTFVTATISNFNDFKTYIWSNCTVNAGTDNAYYPSGTYTDGYYVATADFSSGNNCSTGLTDAYTGDLSDRGFRGTFDGRGHTFTLTAAFYNGGLFNVISGGTVKNFTITANGIHNSGTCAMFGVQIYDATFESLTINILNEIQSSGPASIFAVHHVMRTSYKNVTINAVGLDVKVALGNYAKVGTNFTITCENVHLYSKSLGFWVADNWSGTAGASTYEGCTWHEAIS